MEHPLQNRRLSAMKMNKITVFPIMMILILAMVGLAGCGQADTPKDDESGGLDITQAYQTVDARLTQSVAQTSLPPTATSTPEQVAATPTPDNAVAPEQPSATPTSAEPAATFLPTFTHTPAVRCDMAEAGYPIDVTIPDDTEIPAGNSFTKVWRLVNTGTCNWTAEYTAVFYAGEQMQAPNEVYLSEPVAPGQSIDIDVTMIAPQKTGTYQGNWMLRNADGDIFGIGPNANDSFWVRIEVVGAKDTPTPTASPAPEPDALVSGSATLNVDESIDLDTLQLNTSGGDLAYQQVKDDGDVSDHLLVSLSGVEAAIISGGQPTYGSCKATDMGTVKIDLEEAAEGTYYCYTTNQGLTGWMRFDELDSDNETVTITVLTWAALDD
jgi:hypothetical protein